MISGRFDWEFTRNHPGLYAEDLTVSLTPLDWEYLIFDDFAAFSDALLSLYNLSEDAFPERVPFEWPTAFYKNLSGLSNEELSENCLLVDSDFNLISNWTDVQNCTMCLFPNRTVSYCRLKSTKSVKIDSMYILKNNTFTYFFVVWFS